jgi:hypothetical protein
LEKKEEAQVEEVEGVEESRNNNSNRRSRLSSHGSRDDSEIEIKDKNSHDMDDMVLASCGILETHKITIPEAPQKQKANSNSETDEQNEEKSSSRTESSKALKIRTPSSTTRKMHRILEGIQQELQTKIGDRECYTQFIFL